MAVIETKYSIGDKVYFAGTTTERKQHPCPDCKGERKWKALSPAGSEYEFACPRCSARYNSDRDLTLDYTAHVPTAQPLTIGSVQFNSAAKSWDSGARYMCTETGVGSGSVYEESRLFITRGEALAAAEEMAATHNATMEWVVKLYNKTLEISDYQIENAALKRAREELSRAGSMLWNISDLFDKIENAGDLDAAREAVTDYREYDWERDLDKVAAEIAARARSEQP